MKRSMKSWWYWREEEKDEEREREEGGRGKGLTQSITLRHHWNWSILRCSSWSCWITKRCSRKWFHFCRFRRKWWRLTTISSTLIEEMKEMKGWRDGEGMEYLLDQGIIYKRDLIHRVSIPIQPMMLYRSRESPRLHLHSQNNWKIRYLIQECANL